jgi:hypothetical protein
VGFGTTGSASTGSFTATNAGTTPVTAMVIVTSTANSCTRTPDTFMVTVNPTPTVNATADVTYCNDDAGADIVFSGAVTGTTYNWTSSVDVGFGTTGSASTGSFTATNAGTTPVTAMVIVTPTANSCPGTPDTFLVIVNPTPTVNATPDATYCNGDTIPSTVFGGAVTGTTFNWTSSVDAGFGTAGTDSIPRWVATNPGTTPLTTMVIVIPSSAGCPGTPDTIEFVVNPTPSVVPIPDQSYCNGDTVPPINFTSPVVGTTFGVTIDNNIGANGILDLANGFVVDITPPNPVISRIIVTPSANGCAGAPDTFEITARPRPTVVPTVDLILCEGDINNSPIGWTSDVPGTQFSWSAVGGGLSFGGSGTDVIPPFTATLSGTGVDTTTVIVTPTADGCAGTPDTFLIIVNPLPTITAQPMNQNVCSNATSAMLQVTASEGVADPSNDLNYQWELSTDGGTTWSNVSSSAGGTTETLTVQGAELATGNQFRVIISEGSSPTCTVTSDAATITIQQVDCGTFPWDGN